MTRRTFNRVTISYSLVIDVCRPLMLLSYHGSTCPRKEERERMLSSRRGWHWGQWHASVDISAATPVNVSNRAYRCLRWSPHISQWNVVQAQVQSLSQDEMFGFSFPAKDKTSVHHVTHIYIYIYLGIQLPHKMNIIHMKLVQRDFFFLFQRKTTFSESVCVLHPCRCLIQMSQIIYQVLLSVFFLYSFQVNKWWEKMWWLKIN